MGLTVIRIRDRHYTFTPSVNLCCMSNRASANIYNKLLLNGILILKYNVAKGPDHGTNVATVS